MTPMLSVTQDQTALRRVSAPGQLARQKRQTETAIRRGEFLPYLQCIVDAHSQRIVGAEVLSRWQHPLRGLLSPGAYIPLLYAAGTIHQLDCAMFCHACRLLQRWQGHRSGRAAPVLQLQPGPHLPPRFPRDPPGPV